MTKDLIALDDLINKAVNKESELEQTSKELAQRDEQFAQYLKHKKIMDDELKTLWDMVKETMEEQGLTEHENDYIKLTLSPSGKYRLTEGTEIDEIDNSLCKVVKTLDNKKVKAYFGLNNSLPKGIESTGNILRKKLK